MKDKVRMIEWMVRLTAVVYTIMGSPPLYLKEITNYKPRQTPSDLDGPNPWAGLIKRATEVGDDGHASKVIRALIHGQETSKPYEGRQGFILHGDMWLKIGHMCMFTLLLLTPASALLTILQAWILSKSSREIG